MAAFQARIQFTGFLPHSRIRMKVGQSLKIVPPTCHFPFRLRVMTMPAALVTLRFDYFLFCSLKSELFVNIALPGSHEIFFLFLFCPIQIFRAKISFQAKFVE